MAIEFSNRVSVPLDVLVSNLDGESVFLNLQSESYFTLDEVGTRMWEALTGAESIQAAFDVLAREYDVDPAHLRQDLEELLGNLVGSGLVELHA